LTLNTDFDETNPDVLNMSLIGTETLEQLQETVDTNWVVMDDAMDWYAQSFKLSYINTSDDDPICSKVSLYLKKTGTLTSSMYLKVYIVKDNGGEPDFAKCYAKGRLSLNNVISESGAWYDIAMSYWDYPQNLFDYNNSIVPTKWLVCKVEGVDANNYISWNYNDEGGYTNGRMLNSDEGTPEGQDGFDYCFRVYCRYFAIGFYPDCYIISPVFNAGSDFVNWGRIYVNLDNSRADRDVPGRYATLRNIYYSLSTNGTVWEDYKQIENGGVPETPGSSYCYIKVKAYFYNFKGTVNYKNDSITLLNITVNYSTQDELEILIDSCVWEDRYYCSFYSVNGERLPT